MGAFMFSTRGERSAAARQRGPTIPYLVGELAHSKFLLMKIELRLSFMTSYPALPDLGE
jgi:hypothetical protein